jgi:redox-sensitive bicupin YhaK (pirin superfamily)
MTGNIWPLWVLADTTIEPGSGFPSHPHRETEIVTYVCQGTLVHEDTTGRRGLLNAGGVQAMSTGTGVRHSEVNGGAESCRLYQLWMAPRRAGLAPRYVDVPTPKRASGLSRLASRAESDGGAWIDSDVTLSGARLEEGECIEAPLDDGAACYVIAVRGRVSLGDVELGERDGAFVYRENLALRALTDAEVLVAGVPRL